MNADVWSLGGTVIQMITSLHPWHERQFGSAIDLMQFVALQQDEYVTRLHMRVPMSCLSAVHQPMLYTYNTCAVPLPLVPSPFPLLSPPFPLLLHFSPSLPPSPPVVSPILDAHRSPQLPEMASDKCLDFLRQCFQRDPSVRPSAADLQSNHPFLRHDDGDEDGDEDEDKDDAGLVNIGWQEDSLQRFDVAVALLQQAREDRPKKTHRRQQRRQDDKTTQRQRRQQERTQCPLRGEEADGGVCTQVEGVAKDVGGCTRKPAWALSRSTGHGEDDSNPFGKGGRFTRRVATGTDIAKAQQQQQQQQQSETATGTAKEAESPKDTQTAEDEEGDGENKGKEEELDGEKEEELGVASPHISTDAVPEGTAPSAKARAAEDPHAAMRRLRAEIAAARLQAQESAANLARMKADAARALAKGSSPSPLGVRGFGIDNKEDEGDGGDGRERNGGEKDGGGTTGTALSAESLSPTRSPIGTTQMQSAADMGTRRQQEQAPPPKPSRASWASAWFERTAALGSLVKSPTRLLAGYSMNRSHKPPPPSSSTPSSTAALCGQYVYGVGMATIPTAAATSTSPNTTELARMLLESGTISTDEFDVICRSNEAAVKAGGSDSCTGYME